MASVSSLFRVDNGAGIHILSFLEGRDVTHLQEVLPRIGRSQIEASRKIMCYDAKRLAALVAASKPHTCFSNISSLNLDWKGDIEGTFLFPVDALPYRFPSLTSLTLRYPDSTSDSLDLDELARACPHLKKLDIAGCVPPRGRIFLMGEDFDKLPLLELCLPGPVGIERLRSMTNLMNRLIQLGLPFYKGSDFSPINPFPFCPSLTALDFVGGSFTDLSLIVCSLPKLNDLTIAHCDKIQDFDFLKKFKLLKLNVIGTCIGNSIARICSAWADTMTNISVDLDLQNGFEYLQQLPMLRKLSLMCSLPPYNYNWRPFLEVIARLPLEELYVSDSSFFSKDIKNKIKQEHPGLKLTEGVKREEYLPPESPAIPEQKSPAIPEKTALLEQKSPALPKQVSRRERNLLISSFAALVLASAVAWYLRQQF